MNTPQVKSLIERMARLPAHCSVEACRFEITDADARHQYALGRLVKWGDCYIPPISRARSAAGRILGCSSDTVKHRANVWRKRGSYEAARAWAVDLRGQPWSVCDLPDDCVGHLYVLSCPDYPGLFKIGFSRDPESRRRALASQYKTPLVLEHSQVGTWLDEHLAHLSLLPFQMANEWFDMSGEWKGKLPISMFYAPHRMWSELHEAVA